MSEFDEALRSKVVAIWDIHANPTPWQSFQDTFLRRKPNHRQRVEQQFAAHIPRLATLLREAVAHGDLTPSLAGEISSLLVIYDAIESQGSETIEDRRVDALIGLLPFVGAFMSKLLKLSRSERVYDLVRYRMSGLGRRVLNEHGITLNEREPR